jgi:hypothetical protein
MNHAYSLVWNARLQAYCVTSETAHRRGKSSSLKPLEALLLSSLALSAHTLPDGGQRQH